MYFWKNVQLWHKVLFGLVAGIIVGVIFKENAVILKPLGDIFIRLIKMIIVPLIYVSIVMGMTQIDNDASISRITIKSLCAFLLTSTFAIMIGLFVAYIIKPGVGVNLQNLTAAKGVITESRFGLDKIINDVVPDNALHALVSGNLLQVVFLAFFTGIVINNIKEDKPLIARGFKVASKVVFKMVTFVLHLAPFGAFGLTASVVGTQGIGSITSLGMLIFALIIGLGVQYLVFGILIFAFARLSPMPFYKKSLEYQAMAFSTSSSKATLPTTMEVCMNKMGISRNSTFFVLPLGASINMDGMAIYLSICALFFAQIYGIDLSVMDYVVIVFTATLGSIGGAGVPSGTIIMLPIVLGSVGIPVEGIAFIVGIDRILDMMRTTLNITGDAAITLIVDASEKTLNKKVYYAPLDKLKTKELV